MHQALTMRPLKTAAEATRLAVANGATLEIGGRVINAAGRKADLVVKTPERAAPIKATAPPVSPPAPAIPPGMTEDQVQRLIENRDQMWQLRLDTLQHQIDILTGLVQNNQRGKSFVLRAEYLDDMRIDRLVVERQQ